MNRRDFAKTIAGAATVGGISTKLLAVENSLHPHDLGAVANQSEVHRNQLIRMLRRYVRTIRRDMPDRHFMETWLDFETKSLHVGGYYLQGKPSRSFAETLVFDLVALDDATRDVHLRARMARAIDHLRRRTLAHDLSHRAEGARSIRVAFVS